MKLTLTFGCSYCEDHFVVNFDKFIQGVKDNAENIQCPDGQHDGHDHAVALNVGALIYNAVPDGWQLRRSDEFMFEFRCPSCTKENRGHTELDNLPTNAYPVYSPPGKLERGN